MSEGVRLFRVYTIKAEALQTRYVVRAERDERTSNKPERDQMVPML